MAFVVDLVKSLRRAITVEFWYITLKCDGNTVLKFYDFITFVVNLGNLLIKKTTSRCAITVEFWYITLKCDGNTVLKFYDFITFVVDLGNLLATVS